MNCEQLEDISEIKRLVSEDKFVVIYDFMTRILDLSGTELIIFAKIYGFSVNVKSGLYNGSIRYLADVANTNPSTVVRNLKKLVKSGLILRMEEKSGYSVSYCANLKEIALRIKECNGAGSTVAFCNSIGNTLDMEPLKGNSTLDVARVFLEKGENEFSGSVKRNMPVAKCNTIQEREKSRKKEFGIPSPYRGKASYRHGSMLEFETPSLEDVTRFLREEELSADSTELWNKFNSLNWTWKNSRIRCWRAFLRNWINKSFGKSPETGMQNGRGRKPSAPEERVCRDIPVTNMVYTEEDLKEAERITGRDILDEYQERESNRCA